MFANWPRCSPASTLLAASLLIYVTLQTAVAQDVPPPPALPRNPNVGGNLTQFFTAKTPYEFWLTFLIGLFGLAIIGVLMFSFRRLTNPRPEDISRPIIVITVITGTLMLVTVGYSNEQIAPAFGLFGTIVGYMLGRFAQSSAADAQHDQQHGASADRHKPPGA